MCAMHHTPQNNTNRNTPPYRPLCLCLETLKFCSKSCKYLNWPKIYFYLITHSLFSVRNPKFQSIHVGREWRELAMAGGKLEAVVLKHGGEKPAMIETGRTWSRVFVEDGTFYLSALFIYFLNFYWITLVAQTVAICL